MKTYFLLSVLVGCGAMNSGCTSLEVALTGTGVSNNRMKDLSSGHIGCLPDAISIDSASVGWQHTIIWRATCNGITYVCSYYDNEKGIVFGCTKEQ